MRDKILDPSGERANSPTNVSTGDRIEIVRRPLGGRRWIEEPELEIQYGGSSRFAR